MADTPMLHGYERIGDQRYREVVGFVYEEFTVGDVIEHRPGRTITEMDNVLMSMLSMNDAPLHIDAAYCATLPWQRPLVSSLVTLSIVGGMTARSTSGKALANLGWDHIRLPNPVFPGDTLYAESEVLSKRLSRSRPGQGIVTCRTTGTKSTGEVVLVYERSFLVPCHSSADTATTAATATSVSAADEVSTATSVSATTPVRTADPVGTCDAARQDTP